MRIAVIDLDNLKNPFWAAGQARSTREIYKRLSERHDITVYCAKYPGYQDYHEDGIFYKHVGALVNQPQISNLLFLLYIPLLVRKIEADIIIENFNAPTGVSFSPLFTRIPVLGIPTMFNAREFSKKYHLPFHWIERLGIKFYKYMVAYSEIDSTKINRLAPHTVCRIIPQGVGEEFFRVKHRLPIHILFLGRYDMWQKGIDLLLHAYVKVKDRIGYPLVLAGHGSDEDKIRKLISQLDLQDKVHLVGKAYGEKKNDLISDALFVAFPSRHDEISLWSLEALASGLPLIAFDLPECHWISDKVSLKARPFDIDEYAKILLQAKDNKVLENMKRESRIFASRYSWDTVAQQYERFILDIYDREKHE